MAVKIRIHLFGLPDVLHGNAPAPDFPTDKVRLLFFFLALFRQTAHTRSVLASTFWGECPELRARHSLSTALWRLRTWIESLQLGTNQLLLIEDQQVAFNMTGAYWLDTAEFEEHINQVKRISGTDPSQIAVSLTRAIELYRGDLLQDCYADWCLVERERLRQLYLQSLVHLMVYYGGQGDYAKAIGFGQRIVQDDPLREEVQRELMRLLVLDRKPAEALLQYRRCEAALRQELGIDPMPETKMLLRQLILGADSVPIRPARLSASVEPELRSQNSWSKQIDAAADQLEVARDKIAQALAALRYIQEEASRW